MHNIQASIVPGFDDYVINGRTWWSSGAVIPADDAIFMGKDPILRRLSSNAVDDSGPVGYVRV